MSIRRSLGRVGIAATLATALGVSVLTPPVAAAPRNVPSICANEISAARNLGAETRRLGQGVLELEGRTVTITDDSASWRVYDPIDNTFNNRFHGLQWLVPWAVAGGDAVSLVVARDAALPDPGFGTPATELRATGWTTGASRIRQNTVNCLYAMTGDERLLDVMERLVDVNLDPKRYRGQPLNAVHNHGMLANHALIESGRVFDRPEWVAIAFGRMDADADSVFAPCGMSAEQSTNYQLTNIRIWQRGLRQAGTRSVQVAEAVSSRIDNARLAAVKLARPDGILEAIGNSNQHDIRAMRNQFTQEELEEAGTDLWCPTRGWAANRSSWGEDSIQYTLRFGPRRKMHGHYDHGSLTWFAGGVPVLSDPGLFDKARTPRHRQSISMSAHSVLEPLHRSLPGATQAVRVESPEGVDRYTLVSRRPDLTRTRHVEVNLTHPSLRVRDEARTRLPTQWMQRWQLAPEWTPVRGTSAWTPIAAHPQGLFLYAVCHSRASMRMAVGTQDHYPTRRSVVPSTMLYCGGLDRRINFDTLLVVSDIDGTLVWDRMSGAYAVQPAGTTPAG